MSQSKVITRADMIDKWLIAAAESVRSRIRGPSAGETSLTVEIEAACILAAATEWAAYVHNKHATYVEDEHFRY